MKASALDNLPAATLVAMLAYIGIELYREPTAVKHFLRRKFGGFKGGLLYSALLAGGAAAWWALWRASTKDTVIPDLKAALRDMPARREVF